MYRKSFVIGMSISFALIAAVNLVAILALKRSVGKNATADSAREEWIKTESEWRDSLSPEQYRIMRQKGTELAFTGMYWNTKTLGIYHCAGCNNPLFDSEAKYDSGTGWPSFWKPIEEDHVALKPDRSRSMVRNEVVCSRCGCHLGHVFDDGPEPTGLRYCINSASLNLVEKEARQQ